MHGARVVALAFLERVDAVEPYPVSVGAVGIEVGQRRRIAAAVPFLARGRAGMAADSATEAFSTRTRRSYQAAWPVIGSALLSGASGKVSPIRWLSRKPRANSGDF